MGWQWPWRNVVVAASYDEEGEQGAMGKALA